MTDAPAACGSTDAPVIVGCSVGHATAARRRWTASAWRWRISRTASSLMRWRSSRLTLEPRRVERRSVGVVWNISVPPLREDNSILTGPRSRVKEISSHKRVKISGENQTNRRSALVADKPHCLTRVRLFHSSMRNGWFFHFFLTPCCSRYSGR